ncbi:hypothetical protein ACFWPK_32940 [Nocardia sp. NPDC058519]|uniref:hypothetical protein n=1 Tax=unclassified Nocardia TaxID=2637762 RepID=UPI0036556F0C
MSIYRWKAISVLLLTVSAATLPGCNAISSSDSVEIAAEPAGWDGPFSQLLASHNSARLGDIVQSTGIPVGDWDRLYSFTGDSSSERINSIIGVSDIEWKNRSRSTESTMHVFMKNKEVIYAFDDQRPRNGMTSDIYSTPTSSVTPRAIERGYPTNDTIWVLDIRGGA